MSVVEVVNVHEKDAVTFVVEEFVLAFFEFLDLVGKKRSNSRVILKGAVDGHFLDLFEHSSRSLIRSKKTQFQIEGDKSGASFLHKRIHSRFGNVIYAYPVGYEKEHDLSENICGGDQLQIRRDVASSEKAYERNNFGDHKKHNDPARNVFLLKIGINKTKNAHSEINKDHYVEDAVKRTVFLVYRDRSRSFRDTDALVEDRAASDGGGAQINKHTDGDKSRFDPFT